MTNPKVPMDSFSNYSWVRKFSIVKEYTVFSKVVENKASSDIKEYMIKRFGRVVHSKITDLKPEEKTFLNEYNEIFFGRMSNKLNIQLDHIKNKIGVFHDPVYPMSYPWIIPQFTYECKKSDDYTKPSVFVLTQEFHRGKPLDDKEYDNEMKFWQYKHYEKFHVSDPTVIWGPKDISMCNLVVDNSCKKICFVDNEGFTSFHFTKRDHFRYRVMTTINPNIGEYLPGKGCNTPYETMKSDWNTHDEVKVFFKRLFLYEKVIFDFQFIFLLDEKALDKIKSNAFDEVTSSFNKRMLLWQNWFHHEGEKVMQMTDEYVKPERRLRGLDRQKYSELFVLQKKS